jgi:ankyrin repeat protein
MQIHNPTPMSHRNLISLIAVLVSFAAIAQPPNVAGTYVPFRDARNRIEIEDRRTNNPPSLVIRENGGAKNIFTMRSPGEWRNSGGTYLRWKDDNTFTMGPELVPGDLHYRSTVAPANIYLGTIADGHYRWVGEDGATHETWLNLVDDRQTVHLRRTDDHNVVYRTFKLSAKGYRCALDVLSAESGRATVTWTTGGGDKLILTPFTPTPVPPSAPVVVAVASPPPAVQPAAAPSITALNTLDPVTKEALIHKAVQIDDHDSVATLLKQKADVNVRDGNKSRTALHYSAMKNNAEIAALLVQHDADMNVKDAEGRTALDIALERGNYETAKVLLKNNANAGLASAGLDRVLKTNESELLVLMLQNGADANAAANKAIEYNNIKMLNTVLDNSAARATNELFEKAVSLRNQEAAIELLVRGIDKDEAMSYVIAKKDKTMVDLVLGMNASVASTNKALLYAAEERDLALATKAIVQYNADPTIGMAPAIRNNHMEMVSLLLKHRADPNDQMDEAAGQGLTAIVEALLAANADPDRGIAPAATHDRIAALQVLLDANGDANLAMPIAIEKGNTTMVNMCIAAPKPADVFRAEYMVTTCQRSNLDILNALLLAGAPPDPGMPVAIEKKDANVVRELIGAGARVDRPEYLSKSAQLKDAAVAKQLLDAGADPNSAMLISIELEDPTIVQMMLEHRADGRPPQYISKASELGNTPIVDLLLAAGANANDGMPPAVNKGRTEVVASLLKHGADGGKDMYMSASAVHNNATLTRLLIDAGGSPRTALEPAIEANADKVVALLNEKGVDISATEYLVTCVRKNHVATAQVLVNAGASAATWWDDGAGYGLLHLSIKDHTDPMMATLLVKAGADVNKNSGSGDPPLHIAVMDSRKNADNAGAVVEVLIQAGADVNALNAKGETVLKAAPGKKAITRPLKDAGAKNKL